MHLTELIYDSSITYFQGGGLSGVSNTNQNDMFIFHMYYNLLNNISQYIFSFAPFYSRLFTVCTTMLSSKSLFSAFNVTYNNIKT